MSKKRHKKKDVNKTRRKRVKRLHSGTTSDKLILKNKKFTQVQSQNVLISFQNVLEVVSCLFTFQNVLQVFHNDTKTFLKSKQKTSISQ